MVERDLALCELHNGAIGILPLWVAKLQEEILCPCVSHIDLLHVLIQDLFLFRVRPNPKFEY
jgi:hypothetical protein